MHANVNNEKWHEMTRTCKYRIKLFLALENRLRRCQLRELSQQQSLPSAQATQKSQTQRNSSNEYNRLTYVPIGTQVQRKYPSSSVPGNSSSCFQPSLVALSLNCSSNGMPGYTDKMLSQFSKYDPASAISFS